MYTAVIECAPTVSVDVVYAALPLVIAIVPKIVEPFLNVTVPVGTPEVTGLTVAVKVTAVP